MTDGLMGCHPSPLARAVRCKPAQTRNERGALGGISEIAFHTSIPNADVNHEDISIVVTFEIFVTFVVKTRANLMKNP